MTSQDNRHAGRTFFQLQKINHVFEDKSSTEDKPAKNARHQFNLNEHCS